jgi:hypothetical protein
MKGRARKQFLRAGIGCFVPRGGVLKSFQTDSVAATAAFSVPIRHRAKTMIKRLDMPAMMASLDKGMRLKVLNSRRCAVDPGDVNTLAAVELGRRFVVSGEVGLVPSAGLDPALPDELMPCAGLHPALPDEHRPQIKTHLSKKNYERRTFRHKHARWEVRRRRDNQEYGEAMNILARAGTTWKTTDTDVRTCANLEMG